MRAKKYTKDEITCAIADACRRQKHADYQLAMDKLGRNKQPDIVGLLDLLSEIDNNISSDIEIHNPGMIFVNNVEMPANFIDAFSYTTT